MKTSITTMLGRKNMIFFLWKPENCRFEEFDCESNTKYYGNQIKLNPFKKNQEKGSNN